MMLDGHAATDREAPTAATHAATGRTHRHGLVLGKFYPFHAGHANLIRAASARCERVTVEVLASAVESIPVERRAAWIRAEHPEVTVVTGRDDVEVDYADAAVWDAHMAIIEGLLDADVDAVFTSDEYGAELARRLDAQWVQVDAGRTTLAVSGTAVRADVPGRWWALPTPVRADLARRVVVIGAESTGSTTLARALAAHYGVPWVPEYGRTWTTERPGGLAAPWHTSEFDLIAAEHRRQEIDALRSTPRPLVISDTDVLATSVWHERYMGERSTSVDAMAAAWRPDLYVLTGDEIAWEDDGLRDGEHVRHAMQARFREVLAASDVPWIEVSGTHDERMPAAIERIDPLIHADSWAFTDPLG